MPLAAANKTVPRSQIPSLANVPPAAMTVDQTSAGEAFVTVMEAVTAIAMAAANHSKDVEEGLTSAARDHRVMKRCRLPRACV